MCTNLRVRMTLKMTLPTSKWFLLCFIKPPIFLPPNLNHLLVVNVSCHFHPHQFVLVLYQQPVSALRQNCILGREAPFTTGRTACRSSVVFLKFLFWQCSTMPFLFPCSVQILQNIKSFSWLYLSHEYNLNHLGINLLVGGCFGVSSRGAGFVWSFELFSDSSELPRNTSIIERWSFDRQSFFFGGIADDYLTDYSNRNHAKKIEMLTCFVIVLNTIISRAGRHRSNVQQNAWRMRFC